MRIITKKIEDIRAYKNNPRLNDGAVDMVAKSIKDFGFNVPITLDVDGTIITGHTRFKAAIKLGLEEVPTITLDSLTKDQLKAYRLVDNKVGELAEWDINALQVELDDIQMDMTEFNFEMDEIEKVVEEDDFNLELPTIPKAQLGDIYKLGNHRLICADSTKIKNIKKLVGDKRVDMVMIDPPYNIDYHSDIAGSIKNDNMSDEAFTTFLTDMFKAIDTTLKPGGAFYIWYAATQTKALYKACENAAWRIRQELIWNKKQFVLSRQDYHWKHESCLYGWKDGAAHYFTNDRTKATVIEDEINIDKLKLQEARDLIKELMDIKEPVSVIDEDKPLRSEEHPTMKPIKLMAKLIQNSTKENEIVIDTVGGSGSTLIACEKLNRACYMAELEPKFVDVIITRWENLTGEKAEKC